MGIMQSLWDYDEKELQKTEEGRIFMLERMINYGVYLNGPKIKSGELMKYWYKLQIDPDRHHLLELILSERNLF